MRRLTTCRSPVLYGLPANNIVPRLGRAETSEMGLVDRIVRRQAVLKTRMMLFLLQRGDCYLSPFILAPRRGLLEGRHRHINLYHHLHPISLPYAAGSRRLFPHFTS